MVIGVLVFHPVSKKNACSVSVLAPFCGPFRFETGRRYTPNNTQLAKSCLTITAG
jgi:hypothetical protein